MIDKVLKLKNDSKYYVLDELNYEDRKFVFTVECDLESVSYIENYLILEIIIDNSKLIVKNVDDVNILENITQLFLTRLKNSK